MPPAPPPPVVQPELSGWNWCQFNFDNGDAFTAADISVVYALGLGAMLGLASDYSERIGDYWARMKERPAFKAAAAK